MYEIKRYLQNHDDVYSIINGIESGLKEQLVSGLSGSTRSMLTTLIQEATRKKTLIVTHQLTQAQQLYEDMLEFSEQKNVYLYPVNELLASELAIASPELLSQRITALTNWLKNDHAILIAPVAALKRMMPPKEYWQTYQLDFELEQIIDIDQTLEHLVEMGYIRQDMASSPGEFSLRGGILDIYPITEEQPLRIELFDDEIDSIRYYDAESQRSLEKQKQITVVPATELLLKDSDLVAAAQKLEQSLNKTVKKIKNKSDQQVLTETITADIDRLRHCERFQEVRKYASFFYDDNYSLLDYLPKDGFIILDEMSRIQETASHLDNEEQEWLKDNLQRGKAVSDSRLSFDWHEVWHNMKHQRLYLSVFLRHIPNTNPTNIVNLSCRSMQEFHGQMNLLQNEMERWQKGEFSIIILAPNPSRMEKIQSVLEDYQMSATISETLPALPVQQPVITIGNISGGFELPLHKIAVITENELFKQKTTRKKRKQKISNAERIKSYQELQVGDYVVHANHGIGRYIGIETLEVSGLHKDYMLVKYSGDDKLFVPIDQIDLVQKYVGSEGKEPKLYRLGGNDWKKVKSKVQSKVEDIADDLMKLYAEREAAKGYAFSPETEMQRDFELSFPYQETDDQLRCIEEIKEDMEKERPMDRLLCGDVGYGKTEVAIRAAFKAIADGKQVAILVPTTILAQQHYETVIERFQDYPINIGLLSRFRTRKQQTETLKGLKNGTVDIVIGTHRILSKDVTYKDLGLLIVDEEQRFGVKHKEKIKQLKTNVDVLTLTATPIPRTLHMSMLGVRDLSVIETPPENRFPIQTYVMEYNAPLVREAIERELSRGGQVFFLYNRVESIDRIAQDIQALVEDARVTVAHGQMNESELENVMFSFLEGESDVLVSTTIIETGVDIPNVNTLIVYNGDRMGLSQLYQLRGRVGRSNRVAYAYFTYQQDKVLTEVSEKRLQAIKEFTELGSGFKIAMRDLSIRGAGNILGAQQHGFIDSVGFDMYSQMLNEAVEAKKQGKAVEEVQPFEVELDLKIDAYIPDSYITDEKQKIDMYKRFQSIYSQEDIHDLRDELIDRFGDYPEEVENLFHVSTLKMMSKKERIEAITERKQKIEVIVEEERSQELDGAKLFEFANQYGRLIQLGTENRKLKVEFRFDKNQYIKRYEVLEEFIQTLSEMKQTPVA
ncbi:transcription-repair coupling factor (superfamily II helicase) [Gracilibacillus orientalis]|uniref:Transcription-repair-coupling factor n=1 Tax=Gracilibacillus orientalis TaxID=334253 RepID=A0A1I4RCA6_9BACI|nr:transcription-repair coupling factor [Gracilibacillus orientalis]SFM49918.1 transcription-repair coupling factor (superfamily II helicase) [Gracilibacillus orientalis]